jgi:hypothetical protein
MKKKGSLVYSVMFGGVSEVQDMPHEMANWLVAVVTIIIVR